MADVNISKYRASVVRSGSAPATPGFVVSEGQNPVEPAGSEQNHLPVTINATATGLAITTDQVLSGAGTVGQYIRGDGSLADFPASTGGGSSVSYYLNGSVSQGTIGGVDYKELSKTPILGAGTQFTINADGYIASFLTDAGDPNLLEIPGGNWNFETYFSASSGGGSPTFYVELYKYDGSTFTLIASNSGSPELIAFGTNVNSYFSTLAVPTTALTLTDRLAIRYYVTHSGRTITLHTENNTLCQIITTFTTGLTALNGLTAQVQYFAVGTSGTDFNIASATQTHTFNLPTASASNRGALSSSDWTTFNNKQNALTNPVTGTGTTNYVPKFTSSSSIGNGLIYDNGTTVLIGTTSTPTPVVGVNFPLSVTSSEATRIRIDSSRGAPNYANAGVGLYASGVQKWSFAHYSTDSGANYDFTIYNDALTSSAILVKGSNSNVLIGTTTDAGQKLQVTGTVALRASASGSSATQIPIFAADPSGTTRELVTRTPAQLLSDIGGQAALTNPVTGTGTTNYLAKFTGSTTVGNSQVFDNGTNVGIGTSSPSANSRLHVYRGGGSYDTIVADGDAGTNTGFAIYEGGSPRYALYSNGAAGNDSFNIYNFGAAGNSFTIYTSGNVGINSSSDNGARLQVSGTATILGPTATIGNAVAATNVKLIFNGVASKAAGIEFQQSGTPQWYIGNGIASEDNNFELYNSNGTMAMKIIKLTNAINFIGAATFSSTLRATEITASMPSGNGALYINNSSLTNKNWTFIPQTSSGETDLLLFYTGAAAGTRLTVTNNGNVGIGTSSPGLRLHVSTTAAEVLRLQGTSGGSTNNTQLRFFGSNANTDLWAIGTEVSTGSTDRAFDFYDLVAGANRMRITSGGNVLIGTTNDPGARLNIQRPNDSGTLIRIGNVDFNYFDFSRSQTTGALSIQGNQTGFNNILLAPTSGNVGIGTSSPGRQLEVYSATSDTRIAITNTTSTSGAAKGFELLLAGSDAYAFNYVNGAMIFGTNSTERMRITSGGNVLIGTTTDNGARLQVSGRTTINAGSLSGTFGLNVDVNSTFAFGSTNGRRTGTITRDSGDKPGLQFGYDATDNTGILAGATETLGAGLDFYTYNGSSWGNRMRITAGGEVLIGNTDNGAYNLQCNGTGVWGAGAYVNGSDRNIKDNIATIEKGLEYIQKMNPVKFRYKPNYTRDHSMQTGFIAQELQEVFASEDYLSGLVQQGVHLSVAYQNLLPVLVKAIQEQQEIINDLKQKIQ